MEQEAIIDKKIKMITDTINSDEYKKADIMLKKINKLKDDVKTWCISNDITEKVVNEYKVEYKIRVQQRADTKLLPPELLDEIMKPQKIYLQYYSKGAQP